MTDITELERGQTAKLIIENEASEIWCEVLLSNEDGEAILRGEYDDSQFYIRELDFDREIDVFKDIGTGTKLLGPGRIET
jgi:hypothetical protein